VSRRWLAEIGLTEVTGLPEELEAFRQRLAALEAQDGDGWLRGSEQIGAYVGLSGGAVRRRKTEGEPIPVRRQGRDLVAFKPDLDRWMNNGAQPAFLTQAPPGCRPRNT
jgi:hypothetical protein